MLSQRELDVLRTMERDGGSFVSHLAKAWMFADDDNERKLRMAFPEYWEEYERMLDLNEGK